MANYNRPLSPGSKFRRGPAGPVPLGPPKKPSGRPTKEQIKKIQPKGPANPKTTVKAPVKKKVLVMPNKISPSKMTPAQKARYLKNPERYDG
jgi:hypothetical protein